MDFLIGPRAQLRFVMLFVAVVGVFAAFSTQSYASTQASSAKTTSPIVIGDTCDCSGAGVSTEGGWYAGLSLWARWINAHGGILGHKVTIDEMDTGSSTVTGLDDMKRLLADKKVVAIVPGAATGADLSSAISAAKAPVVGGLDDDPLWISNPYVFPTSTTENGVTGLLAAIGVKHAANKNAADFYCAEVAVCQESEGPFATGVAAAGGKLVYQASISATAPNYTAQCLAAQAAHAGEIWVADEANIIQEVANNCQAINYRPTFIVPTYDAGFLSAPALNGMKVAFADLPFTGDKAFNSAVKKYDPSLPKQPYAGQYPFQAWVSGEAIAMAIELAKPKGAITRATVFKGLYKFHHQTLGGTAPSLTFAKGKDHSVNCGFAGTINNGKLTASTQEVCP